MTERPNYRVNFNDIPEIRITPEDPENKASFVVRMVHGSDTSLMFAERGPGYHTKPHYHDSEQINYVMSGDIWFFIDVHGYHCVKGDIMRIPRNKIHWAWNRANEDCVLIESHTPPLIGVEGIKDKVMPLLAENEERASIEAIDNIRDPYDQDEVDEIEARAIEEEKQRAQNK
ncbi:cupin domain-containing protein [Thermodesulfobacteriota bacterium]